MSLAHHYNVCFSAQLRVDVKRFNTTDYDQVISQLQLQAKIVVLFSGKVIWNIIIKLNLNCADNWKAFYYRHHQTAAHHLMAATKRWVQSKPKNSKSNLIWIGCDGWSSRDSVTNGKRLKSWFHLTTSTIWWNDNIRLLFMYLTLQGSRRWLKERSQFSL